MMRRLAHLVVLAAFIFSCGGHWGVLQALAWANMIREYSQVVPLREAVSMTFSGQYPCAMCKAIAEKKNTEQQKFVGVDKYQKKFFEAPMLAVAPPASVAVEYADKSSTAWPRAEAPPTPPPQFALS